MLLRSFHFQLKRTWEETSEVTKAFAFLLAVKTSYAHQKKAFDIDSDLHLKIRAKVSTLMGDVSKTESRKKSPLPGFSYFRIVSKIRISKTPALLTKTMDPKGIHGFICTSLTADADIIKT